jgi:hypothetical protein
MELTSFIGDLYNSIDAWSASQCRALFKQVVLGLSNGDGELLWHITKDVLRVFSPVEQLLSNDDVGNNIDSFLDLRSFVRLSSTNRFLHLFKVTPGTLVRISMFASSDNLTNVRKRRRPGIRCQQRLLDLCPLTPDQLSRLLTHELSLISTLELDMYSIRDSLVEKIITSLPTCLYDLKLMDVSTRSVRSMLRGMGPDRLCNLDVTLRTHSGSMPMLCISIFSDYNRQHLQSLTVEAKGRLHSFFPFPDHIYPTMANSAPICCAAPKYETLRRLVWHVHESRGFFLHYLMVCTKLTTLDITVGLSVVPTRAAWALWQVIINNPDLETLTLRECDLLEQVVQHPLQALAMQKMGVCLTSLTLHSVNHTVSAAAPFFRIVCGFPLLCSLSLHGLLLSSESIVQLLAAAGRVDRIHLGISRITDAKPCTLPTLATSTTTHLSLVISISSPIRILPAVYTLSSLVYLKITSISCNLKNISFLRPLRRLVLDIPRLGIKSVRNVVQLESLLTIPDQAMLAIHTAQPRLEMIIVCSNPITNLPAGTLRARQIAQKEKLRAQKEAKRRL